MKSTMKRKRITVLFPFAILISCIFFTLSISAQEATSACPPIRYAGFLFFPFGQQEGFDSPEDAIGYFVSKIRKGDLDAALEAFPIEKAAQVYNFPAYIQQNKYWSLHLMDMPYSSASDFSAEMNRQYMTSNIEVRMNNFIFSFSADPVFLQNSFLFEESTDIVGLMNKTDFDKINNLEVLRVDYANPDLQDSAKYRVLFLDTAALYGADDLSEYSVLYRAGDNELFWGGIQIIWYENRCYLWNLVSTLIDGHTFGYVVPTTEGDYQYGVDHGDFPNNTF